ncbi:MAG TPA: MarR family transcriptional regulator [Candidatus Dormibacteraeota bacterium]|nr:MarR family transcriptional regulator [Candidatus Dormibacteraeota bacterium]
MSVDQVTTARVGYLIKRAQMVLHDAMVDALGSDDLTVTQFAVLTALDDEPGLSNADLARRAFVTPQSMHAVLQELERLRFVVRRTHPQHQRILQAALTEAGRRTLRSAADEVTAVEEQMLRKLSDPARSRLASALSSCIDALTETPTSFRRSSTPAT